MFYRECRSYAASTLSATRIRRAVPELYFLFVFIPLPPCPAHIMPFALSFPLKKRNVLFVPRHVLSTGTAPTHYNLAAVLFGARIIASPNVACCRCMPLSQRSWSAALRCM